MKVMVRGWGSGLPSNSRVLGGKELLPESLWQAWSSFTLSFWLLATIQCVLRACRLCFSSGDLWV